MRSCPCAWLRTYLRFLRKLMRSPARLVASSVSPRTLEAWNRVKRVVYSESCRSEVKHSITYITFHCHSNSLGNTDRGGGTIYCIAWNFLRCKLALNPPEELFAVVECKPHLLHNTCKPGTSQVSDSQNRCQWWQSEELSCYNNDGVFFSCRDNGQSSRLSCLQGHFSKFTAWFIFSQVSCLSFSLSQSLRGSLRINIFNITVNLTPR